MEILDTKRAIERYFNTITPALATAYPGVNFTPPNGVMYQSVQFKILNPTDPTFDNYFHRENLEFQVFVCDVLGSGEGAAMARAELIKSYFPKGKYFLEGTTRIHVLSTPKIQGSICTNDRLIVPVIIPLTVEVYS